MLYRGIGQKEPRCPRRFVAVGQRYSPVLAVEVIDNRSQIALKAGGQNGPGRHGERLASSKLIFRLERVGKRGIFDGVGVHGEVAVVIPFDTLHLGTADERQTLSLADLVKALERIGRERFAGVRMMERSGIPTVQHGHRTAQFQERHRGVDPALEPTDHEKLVGAALGSVVYP